MKGYDGDHELVLEGYSRIAQLIHDSGADGKPLRDVRLGTRVTRVELVEGGGCRVMVDGGEVIGCHAVLCTLPLGVLKQSIAQNTQNSNTVAFNPPLPDWKVLCS